MHKVMIYAFVLYTFRIVILREHND